MSCRRHLRNKIAVQNGNISLKDAPVMVCIGLCENGL